MTGDVPGESTAPESNGNASTLEPWLEGLVRDVVGVGAALPRPLPSRLGDYELTEVLGRGGLGVVYGARDRRLGRLLAIKAMRADRLPTPQDAEREARALAALRHPGIVAIYGVHEEARPGEERELFLVMERVEGRTLSEVLDAGGGDRGRSRRWGAELLEAVAHAHARGVVHGDLKPGNVMIDADGRLRVLDFGLARRVGEEGGCVGGTPGYMAPEQARGELTPRSDVYALGRMLRELWAAGAGRARPSPALAGVLARALEADPSRRPADAGELAAAWARAAALDARRARARRLVAAGAVALASLAAAGAGFAARRTGARPPATWSAERWLDLAPRDRLRDVALRHDGTFVAWLDQNGAVAVSPFGGRRALTGEARRLPLGPDERPTSIGWARDGALLVAFEGRSPRAWHPERQAWAERDAPAGLPAAAPDADLLLVTDLGARLVHALRPGSRRAFAAREDARLLTRAVPSPDGRHFATVELVHATYATVLTVRDAETGRVEAEFDEPRLQQVDAEAGLAWTRRGLVYTRARLAPDAPGTDLVERAPGPGGAPVGAERVAFAAEGRSFSMISASADGRRSVALQPTLEFRTQLGRVSREGGRTRITDLAALDSANGDRVSAFSGRGIFSTASFVRASHDALVRDPDGARARPALDLPRGFASSGPVPVGDDALLAWVWREGPTVEPRLERWRGGRREAELFRLPATPLVATGVPPRSARVRCGGGRCVLGVFEGGAFELRELAAPAGPPLVRVEGAASDAQLLWAVSPGGRLAWCEATRQTPQPNEVRVEGGPAVRTDPALSSRYLTWDPAGDALWISALERPMLRRFSITRVPLDGAAAEQVWSPTDEVPSYLELSPDGGRVAVSGGRLDVDLWRFDAGG